MRKSAFEESILFKALLKIQNFLVAFTSGMVIIFVVTSVFMRYILKMDFTGSEELITIVAMWLYYIGGAKASMNEKHIRADILGPIIKTPKKRAIQGIVVDAISAGVISIFTWWGIQYVIWNFQKGVVSVALEIPLTVSQVALVVGFIFMLFFTLHNLMKKVQFLTDSTNFNPNKDQISNNIVEALDGVLEKEGD